jgi:hypothetical protein
MLERKFPLQNSRKFGFRSARTIAGHSFTDGGRSPAIKPGPETNPGDCSIPATSKGSSGAVESSIAAREATL